MCTLTIREIVLIPLMRDLVPFNEGTNPLVGANVVIYVFFNYEINHSPHTQVILGN